MLPIEGHRKAEDSDTKNKKSSERQKLITIKCPMNGKTPKEVLSYDASSRQSRRLVRRRGYHTRRPDETAVAEKR